MELTPKKMDYYRLVLNIISTLEKKFQTDELAFLALTSKIENVLRDKIAFELHKELSKNKIICREWTNKKATKLKSDLAILNMNSEPELIIEFKAHSSISGIGEWAKPIQKDYEKNRKLYNDAEIITILFANFIDQIPSNQIFNHSIKYYEKLEKSVKRKITLTNQSEVWKNTIEKIGMKCDKEITINAGQFENVNVYINTFIHRIN